MQPLLGGRSTSLDELQRIDVIGEWLLSVESWYWYFLISRTKLLLLAIIIVVVNNMQKNGIKGFK